MQDYVGDALRQQGMSKAVAEEMAIVPGMEEVVSLLHIYRQAKLGHFDTVIVDAAPTGETIRLLTVPETFQWYMDRMMGWGDTTLRLTGMVLASHHARTATRSPGSIIWWMACANCRACSATRR